jgi:hypothetical protein
LWLLVIVLLAGGRRRRSGRIAALAGRAAVALVHGVHLRHACRHGVVALLHRLAAVLRAMASVAALRAVMAMLAAFVAAALRPGCARQANGERCSDGRGDPVGRFHRESPVWVECAYCTKPLKQAAVTARLQEGPAWYRSLSKRAAVTWRYEIPAGSGARHV